MNILLVPDASVNRESAAAVYRVRMKSQTFLGLHSNCISTFKHMMVSDTDTQILDTRTTCALIDSV